jgi:choline dehydrogenase
LIENMTNFPNDLMLNTSISPAQSFVSEDAGKIPSGRARVLGGGSSLNAGFFTYSSPEYVASMGWDGKLVNESYTWVTPIIAGIPELQIFQSTAKAGLLEAGVVPDNGGTFQHLICTKVGGSIFDHTGRRHTAADLLQYSNPDRTTVLLWANTQRVLFDLRNVLSILCRIRHAGPHL